MTTDTRITLPGYLKPLNRVIVLLQRMGLAFFTFHLLSVAGRRSGRMRTTPVSPFTVDGHRYVLSLGQTEWVRNARVAGEGVLSRGRRRRPVALVEIEGDERARVVREFPRQIPQGAKMFADLGIVAGAGPDDFAAAADRLVLIRLDDLDR